MTFRYRLEGDDRPAAELPRFETLDELEECLQAHAEQEAELAVEARYERWLEDGGPHAEVIAWEHEQDMLRAPFDPQGGYLAGLTRD